MDFLEFWRRFGGSSRRKHVRDGLSISAGLERREDYENKRQFALPASLELPQDFIRMEPLGN